MAFKRNSGDPENKGTQNKKVQDEKFFTPPMIVLMVLTALLLFSRIFFTPVRVDGESMTPTFQDRNYLISRNRSSSTEIVRGDVVIIDADNYGEEGALYIKRVIATPGETVAISRDGTITIDGEVLTDTLDLETIWDLGEMYSDEDYQGDVDNPLTLGENEYFCLGDNRNGSFDCRYFGPVDVKDIKGVAKVRLFPFSEFTKINPADCGFNIP